MKTIKQHRAYDFNISTLEESTYELKETSSGYALVSDDRINEEFNTLIGALNRLDVLGEPWFTRIDLKTRL